MSSKRTAGAAALIFLAAIGMIVYDPLNLDGGYARRLDVLEDGGGIGGKEVIKAGAKWAQNHPASRDDCPLADLDLVLPMHHKDFPLASVLFNSLERALPCFHELIIIVPPESEFALLGGIPAYAKVFVVPDPLPEKLGYLSQQVIKLYADTFTMADRIMFLEADSIMKDWHDECYFGVDEDGRSNGKVKAYCIDVKGGATDIWFKGTTHAIGGEMINYDCCVNTPTVYPREVFPALRKHISELHKKPFGKFMEDYFEGHLHAWTSDDLLFSEFNILNHFMIRHRPDLVDMVTPDTPDIMIQRKRCSEHFIPVRNDKLSNPKLSSEYFEFYYQRMDAQFKGRDDGRIRADLKTKVYQDEQTAAEEGGASPPPNRALEVEEAQAGKQARVPATSMRGNLKQFGLRVTS